MVEVSWTSLSEVNPGRNYLAYAAFLERKGVWSFFSFLMRGCKVQKQLSAAKGLVGFTVRLEFFCRKAVQLAVFKDERALKAFAHTGQHALCIETTKSSIKWIKKAIWSIKGSEVPPKLNDAINRIQSQTR